MLRDWAFRLRSLFKRSAVEQELDEELRFHFEHLVESHLRQGLARDEAVRRARLQFGGLDQIKEEHRDARGITFVSDLSRDVRYAARQVRRSPGFALLAMLCLGLGIGVNTSIFGVVNWVLLRPMPVDEPDRLLLVSRSEGAALSFPAYRDFQARTSMLAGLAAAFATESDLDIDGESDIAVAEAVTANYAEVLGIRPVLGRWFVDDREPVAVISHTVWERRFHRSPHVAGRVIRSETQAYTIVGVAPPEYSGVFTPMRTDLWVPIETRPRLAAQLENRESRGLMLLFGRLRDGPTTAQAAAELNAIDAQLMVEQGAPTQRPGPIVAEPVRGFAIAGTRRLAGRLTTLLAAVVGLVLLIACVNVGNLLLARGALRQREFAVRRALGASRFRLLRQLLIESLLLAIGGGICGVILANWTNRLLEMSFPAVVAAFALHMDLSLDWRVIGFATIASLSTTVLCGLLPAWRTSQVPGLAALKSEIGQGAPRRRPWGLVAQVVMSLALLFVAGSFLQAVRQLQATDPGFAVDGRLYAYTSIPSPNLTAESRRELYSQALEQLRALPGVQSAALAFSLPLMPTGSDCTAIPAGPQIPMTTSAVDAGYFHTMGIHLVSGRDFAAEGPAADGAASVVVNESLALRLWPDGQAVGERVLVGCKSAQPAVVIGVVRDSAIRALADRSQPHLYRRFVLQQPGGLTTILVATSADAGASAETVRRTLLGLGQGIRVYSVQPLSIHVEQSYANIRWFTKVLTGFGLLALLLAAVGLYGTMAYRVTLRTPEIGVRMALGASRWAVFREVVSQGLAIVLVGVTIGEIVTAGMTGVARFLQEGIAPTSLWTHIAIGLIWVAVALTACYVPAARAARVDPLVALRHE